MIQPLYCCSHDKASCLVLYHREVDELAGMIINNNISKHNYWQNQCISRPRRGHVEFLSSTIYFLFCCQYHSRQQHPKLIGQLSIKKRLALPGTNQLLSTTGRNSNIGVAENVVGHEIPRKSNGEGENHNYGISTWVGKPNVCAKLLHVLGEARVETGTGIGGYSAAGHGRSGPVNDSFDE